MANLNRPEFDQFRDEPGFVARRAFLGRQLGARRLGLSYWEVDPGEAAYPYHHHLGDEEIVVILEGRPTLRGPDGSREVDEGEVLLFPVGETGGHQLVNRSDATVRFLAISPTGSPDVVVYPDSGKVGAFERLAEGGGFEGMFRRSDEVAYHDGERPPG